MENKLYTISVYTENCPGVLQRVTTSFTKRKINIESLTVSDTSQAGISLITMTAWLCDKLANTIARQLERFIEVRKVFARTDSELVFKEIAMIRVTVPNPETLTRIEEVVSRHNARVVYVEEGSAIVEAQGSEDETRLVFKTLEVFGVMQFARSGRIALGKKFISINS